MLTGTLAETIIEFAIELPDLTSVGNSATEVEALVNGINNDIDENELNRQVFGLLVFNKFLPQEFIQGEELIGGSAVATMSEFVSNQFSKLLSETLSEFIPDSDFSVKWRRYDAESVNTPTDIGSGNEFELLWTQRLFKDRVSINVGGNFDVGKNIDEETSNIAVAGDFIFQYMITEEGNIRLKVYGKNTRDAFTGDDNDVAGISLFASEEFDDFEDLRRNFKTRRVQRKLRKIQKEKERQNKADLLSTTQNDN